MRHAIYYAPPAGSTLHRLGSSWLGRDAVRGEAVRQPTIEKIKDVTVEPARYGFHATLKAPFTLNAEMKRVELGDAVALLAAQMETVTIPKLVLRDIDGFLALVPDEPIMGLSVLAEFCVCAVDAFRTQAGEAELQRRRATKLSPRQEFLLMRWGYPYVLDEFRFHMTLTRRLMPDEKPSLLTAANEHFSPVIGQLLEIDALTVFAESRFDHDFVAEERFPLRQVDKMKVAS
jgi:putative phosphonate metabolism protein